MITGNQGSCWNVQSAAILIFLLVTSDGKVYMEQSLYSHMVSFSSQFFVLMFDTLCSLLDEIHNWLLTVYMTMTILALNNFRVTFLQ